MEEEQEIIDKAIERVRNLNTTWRVNYSIGFRNGDVRGGTWEDETLLKSDEESRIRYLKNMGTKHSLAQQIVELQDEVKVLRKGKDVEDIESEVPDIQKITRERATYRNKFETWEDAHTNLKQAGFSEKESRYGHATNSG